MELAQLKPRKALNKAFLKVKPIRTEIESFKTNLIALLDRTNDTESEEFHKNLVSEFLKKTYYKPKQFINTKGRNDLVIHNGNTAKSTVGVIIEAKKPTNKAEMMSTKKLVLEDRFEAYNLPLGCISHAIRAQAGGLPGALSKVGLDICVCPRR